MNDPAALRLRHALEHAGIRVRLQRSSVVDHGGVVRRHELTDQTWELLAPLIPRAATGRPRVSDRQVANGMVCKIRTGTE
ncbi:transposase [Streptomyces sp. NPDC046832]|uniref:transposase n=1 Tax=Streptomyces sp. NPDC046832 TaxID=3155020 RepID=UPI0033CFD4B7